MSYEEIQKPTISFKGLQWTAQSKKFVIGFKMWDLCFNLGIELVVDKAWIMLQEIPTTIKLQSALYGNIGLEHMDECDKLKKTNDKIEEQSTR